MLHETDKIKAEEWGNTYDDPDAGLIAHIAHLKCAEEKNKQMAELVEKTTAILHQALQPENMECDGTYCIGCWKDKVNEVIRILEQNKKK